MYILSEKYGAYSKNRKGKAKQKHVFFFEAVTFSIFQNGACRFFTGRATQPPSGG